MDKLFNLMDMIEQWQVDYCNETKAKDSGDTYYQVPIPRRKELLTILVCQIKAAGKPQDYFSNSRRDEIVAEIIPRGKKQDKAMIDGFRKATRKQLNWVILEVYRDGDAPSSSYSGNEEKEVEPQEPKVVKRKHDPSLYADEPAPSREMDPEMVELLGLKDKK